MVTNYPRSSALHHELPRRAETHEDGFHLFEWVRQIICGMHGHDNMLSFGHDRMYLRCVSCGHESPGWELNEAPPTVTRRGDARRHSLVRPQLISARRIA